VNALTLEWYLRLALAVGLLSFPLVVLEDLRLQAALLSWRAPALNIFWEAITRLGNGVVDIGIFLVPALWGWWRGNRDRRNRGLLGAATAAGAGILDQILKNVLCRARPNAPEAGAFFTNFPCFPAEYAYGSFPSGHTTTAFAAAVLLALWYPRWAGAWLTLALLVGLSRIMLGSHFPSDVLAGALLGSGLALAVHAAFPAARRVPPGHDTIHEEGNP